MKAITQELAETIASLAFETPLSDFSEHYTVQVGNHTIYREFKPQDLMFSLMIGQKADKGKRGVHFNMMNNGDIFARNYPYYDGVLDGLIAVRNQRKIAELCPLDNADESNSVINSPKQ